MEDDDVIQKVIKLNKDLENDYHSLNNNTLSLDQAKAINKIAQLLIKIFILQIEQVEQASLDL